MSRSEDRLGMTRGALLAVVIGWGLVGWMIYQGVRPPSVPEPESTTAPWTASSLDDSPVEQPGSSRRGESRLPGGLRYQVVTLDGLGDEIRKVVDSRGRILMIDYVVSPEYWPQVTHVYDRDNAIERRWQYWQHREELFAEGELEGKSRQQFLTRACATCHGLDGGGSFAMRAPPLAGLPAWYLERQIDQFTEGSRVPLEDPEPDGVGHGQLMVGLLRRLTPADRKFLAVHFSSLDPRTREETLEGDADFGEERYRASCALCHGPEARGLHMQGGPPLDILPAWVIRRQVHAFRDGRRSGGPHALSMGLSVRDLEEEVLDDIIAWLGMTSRE